MELDQVKSRFFANISHELRTPLTLLIAPVESLLHRFSRSFDQDTKALLVTMQSNGMRLLKLINDLLDLVRLESGVMQVKREPLAVDEFIKGLASAARQMADDKRIKLETWIDPELDGVMADRDKLEKIILNLQFNALKFTPQGQIVVRVGLAEITSTEACLHFQVQDSGIGIPQVCQPVGRCAPRYAQRLDLDWGRHDGVTADSHRRLDPYRPRRDACSRGATSARTPRPRRASRSSR